jgi:hypothetical protein
LFYFCVCCFFPFTRVNFVTHHQTNAVISDYRQRAWKKHTTKEQPRVTYLQSRSLCSLFLVRHGHATPHMYTHRRIHSSHNI